MQHRIIPGTLTVQTVEFGDRVRLPEPRLESNVSVEETLARRRSVRSFRRQPLTLEEIGVKFNLTRERIRQIKEKALRRLKSTKQSKALRAYMA